MKKLITTITMFALAITSTHAQTFYAPSSKRTVYTDTTTTFKYVASDNKTYKVYRSKSGAMYILKTSSKSKKNYKMYLPKEIQVKMGRKY